MIAGVVRSDRLVAWLPAVALPPLLILASALSGHAITVPVVLVAFLGATPLVARHRVSVKAIMVPFVAGIILEVALVRPDEAVVLLPMVMLYDLARLGDRRQSLWLAALTVPSVLISTVPFHLGSGLPLAVALSLLLCLLAIGAGDLLRSRQVAAQRSADVREAQTLQRVGAERLAIAHEIHDTVAHAMTAINVQAGVAAHLIDRDPDQARAALRAIKGVSGEVLTELRGTLRVLRDPTDGAPLAPAADLGDVGLLVDTLQGAGISVELSSAPVGDLSAAIQTAAYRILQEATTNILRHSGADRVSITLGRDAAGIDIDVIDDGVGIDLVDGDLAVAGSGVGADTGGLRGMRERAAACGGTVSFAAARPRGLHVRARLPTPVDRLS